MTFSILFVANNRIQIDILHTSENITLDKWVRLFQCPNQLFDLHTFGFCFFVITGGAGVSKFTSTLNEMQIVIISPRLDAVLADQIHRTDQFHPAEIGAVQLWHHGLYLCAVQHTHQDGLDDIVIVMAESNLVTAQFLCVMIEMPSSHSRTQIARGLIYMEDCLKNIRFVNCNRNIQFSCVLFDHLAVFRAVSRIHHQEFHIKRKLVVQFQLLKQFCHQHRIFSTGDTDCDTVPFFNQFILIDGFCKFAPDGFAELFPDAFFYIGTDVFFLIFPHQIHQPGDITAF